MVPSKPDQSVVAVPVSVQRNKQAVPVQRYGLKGIQHEDPFDHVTRLAASVFSVPISIISIVDNETDCLHSHHCIRAKCDLTCDFNPCRIAINFFAENDDDIFVVPDATLDPRFCQSAVVVGEPGVRFYASARLRVSSGETVGTLCVMDNKPHDLSLEDQQRLVEMAKVAIDLIEFRVHGLEAEKQKKNLELKREQLNLTLENVRDAVLLVDKKFKVVLWNTNFSLLFNYPRELLYEGADAARLIRFSEERGDLWTGNTDEITTSFRDYFAAPTNKRTEIFLKNGKILDIWCETTSGDFYIFSFRDITVPRQMARLKDELVSTVSHELRTPLTSIAGALDLVASDQSCTLSDRVVKLISIARRNSSRLIDIVNDLLELDKLQHGKLQLHKEELDLCGIVTDSVEQNQLYAEKFHVTLQTVVPDRPVMVSADRGRIEQVLANLISNACKFSPPNTAVRVSLLLDGSWARISVADEGAGISEEFRPRLFQRFEQEDGSHQHNGTGLGLTIAKGIVEAHGGNIELDTTVSKGATFHIRLPLLA